MQNTTKTRGGGSCNDPLSKNEFFGANIIVFHMVTDFYRVKIRSNLKKSFSYRIK